MKKLILPAFLATGLVGLAPAASAHGLYVGLGLGISMPRLISQKGTCYSGYQFCYPAFAEYLPGMFDANGNFRGDINGNIISGGWPSVNYDGFGWWFDLGGVETWTFKPETALSFSAAVGWQFPLSPWRVELEFTHTSFDVNRFGLNIFSPGNVTVDDSGFASFDWGGDIGSDFMFMGDFEMDFAPDERLSITTNALMLNTFFRLPVNFLEGFSPYVGFGVGTFSMDVSGGWNQPWWSEEYFVAGESGAAGINVCSGRNCPVDEDNRPIGPWDSEGNLLVESDIGVPGAPANMITGINNRLAFQLMAGVEYRFPGTPFIVGLEYRWMRVDAPDAGNNDFANNRIYVWDNWQTTLENRQIMLRFRYDFISDSF